MAFSSLVYARAWRARQEMHLAGLHRSFSHTRAHTINCRRNSEPWARSRRVFSIKCKISPGSSINCIPIRRVAGHGGGGGGSRVHLNTSGLKIKYYRGKGRRLERARQRWKTVRIREGRWEGSRECSNAKVARNKARWLFAKKKRKKRKDSNAFRSFSIKTASCCHLDRATHFWCKTWHLLVSWTIDLFKMY